MNQKTGALRLLILPCLVIQAAAEQYVISTVAGGAPPHTPAAARSVSIFPPTGVAADPDGNLYFTSNNCIFKLGQDGVLTRLAGNSRRGFSGDGGPASQAQLNQPTGLAFDRSGNLLVVDSQNYRIRRIARDGVISTIAGSGLLDYSDPPADGIPAVNTGLRNILAIATDQAGSIYFSDYYRTGRIRKITPDGLVSTVAGGSSDPMTEDGLASHARLLYPSALGFDRVGNLLIADSFDQRVRRVDLQGAISTIAGTGGYGFSGDGGDALQAQLEGPDAVASDSAGNIFIADRGNYRVRRVSPEGVISTIAGGGELFPGDGSEATHVNFCSESVSALTVDVNDNLYIAACWIQRVTPDGILSIAAGNGNYSFGGDGGPATDALFSGMAAVALDIQGNLLIADDKDGEVRKVWKNGLITTVAGNGGLDPTRDGVQATDTTLHPSGLAVDTSGNIYIADSGNSRVRKVAPNGIITTVAGNGEPGYTGDGGPAIRARISPGPITLDSAGNLYIAVSYRVRKVAVDGTISTIAGNGTGGFSGDGGPAVDASLECVSAVAIDKAGNLLVTDTCNNRIRRVAADGIITTIAGDGRFVSFSDLGDGGPATDATVSEPVGLAIDDEGSIYVANIRSVRKISPAGVIHTIAGNGRIGESNGDGGPALLASLTPWSLTVDRGGRIYVIDRPFSGSRTPDACVRILDPINQPILIESVRNAANLAVLPLTVGEVVVIRGVGMGPRLLTRSQPQGGVLPSRVAGTEVFFNGVPGPVLYASDTEVSAVVPYATLGEDVMVTVGFQGEISSSYRLPLVSSSPGIYSMNGTGAGQAAAIDVNGHINDAAHPLPVGGRLRSKSPELDRRLLLERMAK